MKPDDLAWIYGMQVSDMKDAPGLDGPTCLRSQDMNEWTPNEIHTRVCRGAFGLMKKCNHRKGAVSGMM